jgi:Resolvase, N terminal domain
MLFSCWANGGGIRAGPAPSQFRPALDTLTPSGRPTFQMMGVFAEFARGIIRERVLSGIARAKAESVTLGRPALEDSNTAKVAAIKTALAANKGLRRIARDLRTGVGTVLRIKLSWRREFDWSWPLPRLLHSLGSPQLVRLINRPGIGGCLCSEKTQSARSFANGSVCLKLNAITNIMWLSSL